MSNLALDLRGHRAFVKGQPVEVPPTEFKILRFLMFNRGRAIPLSAIMERVWGYEVARPSVYVHIFRLRKRLGVAGNKIKTIKSHGFYKFTG